MKAWLISMSAVGSVFKEHIKNFYLVQRLAQFQIKITNTNNYLGVAWELLNPITNHGLLVCIWYGD